MSRAQDVDGANINREVTLLRGARFAIAGTQVVTSLADVAAIAISSPWSWATFRGQRRGTAEVVSVGGLSLDIDEGLTITEGRRRLDARGWGYRLVATRHHQLPKGDQPACDRFRILLETDRAMSVAEYEATLAELLKEFPEADKKAIDPGHCWYPGREVVCVVEGPAVNVVDAQASPPVSIRLRGATPIPPLPADDRVITAAMKFAHATRPSIAGKNGRGKLARASLVLVRDFRLDDATCLKLLKEEFNPRCKALPGHGRAKWSTEELRQAIHRARHVEAPHHVPGYGIDRAGDVRWERDDIPKALAAAVDRLDREPVGKQIKPLVESVIASVPGSQAVVWSDDTGDLWAGLVHQAWLRTLTYRSRERKTACFDSWFGRLRQALEAETPTPVTYTRGGATLPPPELTMSRALILLGLDPEGEHPATHARVGRLLRRLGYAPRVCRRGGKLTRVYERQQPVPAPQPIPEPSTKAPEFIPRTGWFRTVHDELARRLPAGRSPVPKTTSAWALLGREMVKFGHLPPRPRRPRRSAPGNKAVGRIWKTLTGDTL